jgi:hypothetical protein
MEKNAERIAMVAIRPIKTADKPSIYILQAEPAEGIARRVRALLGPDIRTEPAAYRAHIPDKAVNKKHNQPAAVLFFANKSVRGAPTMLIARAMRMALAAVMVHGSLD